MYLTCKLSLLLAAPWGGSYWEEVQLVCKVTERRQHEYLEEVLVDCTKEGAWLEQDKKQSRPLVFWDNTEGGSCE